MYSIFGKTVVKKVGFVRKECGLPIEQGFMRGCYDCNILVES